MTQTDEIAARLAGATLHNLSLRQEAGRTLLSWHSDDLREWGLMAAYLAKYHADAVFAQHAPADIAYLLAENARLRVASQGLVDAADSGEWHSSDDCRVEERADVCLLCQALEAARAALEGSEG